MIEGCEITLPESGKFHSATNSLISMNTENILFICGGAFSGINDSKNSNPIGFLPSNEVHKEKSSTINHESIIDYGIMQELVGRLPILVTLDDLDEEALCHILTQPEDSIVKEYQMLFEKDGVHLQFDDDALEEIARMALANKTGARGLRTILEDVLMDIMYDLPNLENISECIITKETLSTKVPVLIDAESISDYISEQGTLVYNYYWQRWEGFLK